ncbi:hypothetical protein GCM10010272_06040 [Streptomyces lateritius]|nr:hypothetical protein GCM10010272_06040 [Streptomyces lateritius]
MGEEEAAHEEQQGLRDAEDRVAGGLQGLRQQVESDHAEHQSAGEAEDQVAPVGDALGRPAAEERHEERAERDENGHAPLLSDRARTAHIAGRPVGRLVA